MAFLEKVTQAAKTIGDKAGDAVESGKLTLKIQGEKSAVEDTYKLLGEAFYKFFKEGGEVSPEVKALCDKVDEHLAEIENLKAQKENQ